MKYAPLVMAALSLLFAATPHAHADVIVTSGASDGIAYDDWYGGPHSRGVFCQDTTTIGSSFGNAYWNFAVMEFPVAAFAGQSNLQATMELYLTQSPTGLVDLRYCGQGTGSIAYRDYLNEGTSLTTFNTGAVGWKSFNVSSGIQDAANHGYSWAVFSAVVGSGTSVRFATAENAGFGPRITVVPEPASLALVALGAMLLLRRRQKTTKP
jgi:hypothetical protein